MKPVKPRKLAHSLLLQYFVHPAKIDTVHGGRQAIGWESALGESWESAIRGLVQDGMLVPYVLTPDDCSGIQSVFGLAELKQMAKERGLKVGGPKEALARRLLAADFAGITAVIAGLGLLCCSPAGLLSAGGYDERRKEMLRAAETALRAENFEEAIEAKESFDREVGFPKWEFEAEFRPEDLRRVMTASPSGLQSHSARQLQELRLAAALATLGIRPPSGLSAEARRGIGTLLSFASTQRNLDGWRHSGVVNGVRILGSNDGPCDACRKLHNHVWRLDEVPEVPNPTCTSTTGCRCVIVAELCREGRS
jgi:hypothetical protein